MFEKVKKALILAPHTDDGELGCGGTIVKLLEEGIDVYYIAFSTAEESVPEGLPKDILSKEVKEATKILGIKSENLIILKYPVRKFNYYRQEILEDIVKLNKNINPDIVFTPSINDIHQDHYVIANEAMRAFKKKSILSYEILWNNFTFKNQCFVRLEERHINLKIEALKCYKSQSFRSYMNEDFIKGLARARGEQISVKYAEVFEVVRWVI